MRMTTDGIALIKSFEGCALTAYQDQEGIWTIGWGHTYGVRAGETCTQEQADAWLGAEIAELSDILSSKFDGIATPLNDNQFSAVLSFCYNVGLGDSGVKDGFFTLKNGNPSTLWKCIQVGELSSAAGEFPKWDHVGGKVSAGILRRRLAEQALFLS